jgi:hypothetical protein
VVADSGGAGRGAGERVGEVKEDVVASRRLKNPGRDPLSRPSRPVKKRCPRGVIFFAYSPLTLHCSPSCASWHGDRAA